MFKIDFFLELSSISKRLSEIIGNENLVPFLDAQHSISKGGSAVKLKLQDPLLIWGPSRTLKTALQMCLYEDIFINFAKIQYIYIF